MRTTRSSKQRRGASIVEFAFIVPIFILMLFSFFEYGRLFFARNVMDAAVREGARFAVVNGDSGTVAQVQSVVDSKMGLIKNFFTGSTYTTNVFWLRLSDNTEQTPYNNAQFGNPIGVRVSGDFKTLFPKMLMNNQSSFTLRSTCYMLSEGN